MYSPKRTPSEKAPLWFRKQNSLCLFRVFFCAIFGPIFSKKLLHASLLSKKYHHHHRKTEIGCCCLRTRYTLEQLDCREERWELQRCASEERLMRGLIRVFERSHLRLGWSIILSLRDVFNHMWYEHPMYARWCARPSLGAAYFHLRAKTNLGDAGNHAPSHPRAFPVVALSFERESVTFLQPTNSVLFYLRRLGKRNIPHDTTNGQRHVWEQQRFKQPVLLFAPPKTTALSKKKKKKKERKRGPGKARVFRAFSHRSKFVEKKKKKRCIRLRRKARKEARIRRRKYTTCTRTFCTKTRRRV